MSSEIYYNVHTSIMNIYINFVENSLQNMFLDIIRTKYCKHNNRNKMFSSKTTKSTKIYYILYYYVYGLKIYITIITT